MRIARSRAPLRVFALALAAELALALVGVAWLAARPWPVVSP